MTVRNRHANDNRPNDGQANDGQANDRQANDRQANDRQANDRQANDRQANDGRASDVNAAGPLDLSGVVAAIHATDTRAVVAVTGGGVAALNWLLGVPGASRTVLEASVPYAAAALEQLIGQQPDQAVSASTAAAMAEACLQRAIELTNFDPGLHVKQSSTRPASAKATGESTSIRPYGPNTTPPTGAATLSVNNEPLRMLVGVSATAALVSDRPKRGDHRAHVGLAWRDGSAFGEPGPGRATWTLLLAKGARDRASEDCLVSALVIAVLAHGCGLSSDAPSRGDPDGSATTERLVLPTVWPVLLEGDVIEPAWPA